MDDVTDKMRKRLRFRAWHRGTKESDLMLGRFADTYLDGFSSSELLEFERLLDCPDPELVDWMTGRAPFPEEIGGKVATLLQSFVPAAGNR